MTKIEEIEKALEELKKKFEKIKEDFEEHKVVSYEEDTLFLLSKEEYEMYKDVIPHINTYWWLRSPSDVDGFTTFAPCVRVEGELPVSSYLVDNYDIAVRPALRVGKIYGGKWTIGEIFVYKKFPFVYIGDGLAIAEVPIGFEKFDNYSNDYKTSHVRKWLKDWEESR